MKTGSNKDVLMKTTFKRLLMIQILSSFSAFIGPLIDGIIVSDFMGPEYMAAFGIIAPITIFAAALSNVFHAGSQNVAGKYLGQGRSDKINSLLTTTFLWEIAAGLIVMIIVLVLGEPILALLGAEGETMKKCNEYISMYAYGIIPTVLMPSMVGFLQLDDGGRTAVAASSVMTASDVILDLLAVLVFKNGMTGIGLATTVSYTLAILIILSHFLKKNVGLKFSFKESIGKDIGKIMLYGLPAATILLCDVVRVSVTNNIILRVSDLDSVAAFSIQNTFKPVIMGFIIGTGVTALLVCSVISGEENRRALRKELTYILELGMIIAIVLALVIAVFAKYPLALVFCVGQPDEFTGLVAKAIRLFAASIPFCMLNMIFVYYYQSMRKLLLSTVISVLQNIVFFIASAEILSGFIGVDGVWLSYIVAEMLTFLTILIITWMRNGHFPKSVHDFMLLPDSFGVTAENRMNVTAVTVDEVIGISEKISEFCKGKKIDRRRAMAAALCTEELAVLAIENCDAQRAYVDIYVTFKDGDLFIRMRDNSRPFDGRLLAGIPDEDDPCANAGVRVVKGMAKEVTYNVVLGMNMFSMII